MMALYKHLRIFIKDFLIAIDVYLCHFKLPQLINTPNFASSYHCGNGRVSNEAQLGKYFE